MRAFDLYQSPERDPRVEAVKYGFSWPALLFGWVWAIVKGMPALAAVLFGVDLAFAWTETALTGPAWLVEGLGAAFLAKALAVGALANRWRRRHLVARGYRSVDRIEAHSVRGAIDSWLAS